MVSYDKDRNFIYSGSPVNKCLIVNPSKKVFISTNGCPENRIDSARMEEFFRQNGCELTKNPRQADIILFNTCGLTQYKQELSIKTINKLKDRKKPSADLIVCGCLPKINEKRLREVYDGPTFGSDEVERLNEIFEARIKAIDIHVNFLLSCETRWSKGRLFSCLKNHGILLTLNGIPLTLKKILNYRQQCQADQATGVTNPNNYFIKISTGCSNYCSYCAVRLSRGAIKSKPIPHIVKEFKRGLENNYKDFALIGTDLGSYGKDQGVTLIDLLKELIKENGDYRIRLRNVHPGLLIGELSAFLEILESGKISCIGSTAQSGNNRILGLMRRGYRIEDLKEAILTIKRRFPEIYIRTQVMGAFPSETEEEFLDTIRLIDEIPFDFVEVYMFQARPGTEAAKMEGQIPPDISRKRYYKLFWKSMSYGQKKKCI